MRSGWSLLRHIRTTKRSVPATGGSVRVVLVTAGDGYVEAVVQKTGKPRPAPAEYVAYGEHAATRPGAGPCPRATFELTDAEIAAKRAALARYTTQQEVVPTFLAVFVRRTEPFRVLSRRDIGRVSQVDPARMVLPRKIQGPAAVARTSTILQPRRYSSEAARNSTPTT